MWTWHLKETKFNSANDRNVKGVAHCDKPAEKTITWLYIPLSFAELYSNFQMIVLGFLSARNFASVVDSQSVIFGRSRKKKSSKPPPLCYMPSTKWQTDTVSESLGENIGAFKNSRVRYFPQEWVGNKIELNNYSKETLFQCWYEHLIIVSGRLGKNVALSFNAGLKLRRFLSV